MRKKSVGRTNFEESSQLEPPMSEEQPMPLQSINPLAIEVYNPENVPFIESIVSTEFDTFDEDQHFEENPKDGEVQNDEETSNVAENKNFEENPEDGEVRNNEESPYMEENPLADEEESKEINVDTFVAEILTKAQEESSVGL